MKKIIVVVLLSLVFLSGCNTYAGVYNDCKSNHPKKSVYCECLATKSKGLIGLNPEPCEVFMNQIFDDDMEHTRKEDERTRHIII